MKSPLINDSQTLVSAQFNHGTTIPVYDDGYGKLYIHRDSMGVSGIVRAQTWEDAYAICEDEFFQAGDNDANEETQRIEAMPDGEEKKHALACWDEAYGYRNNTRGMPDGTRSSIYAKDLNGDALDILTPALVESLGITLNIEGPATTEAIFDSIMESSIFRLNGPKIDLCQALIDLCAAIKAEEETNWSLGECGECTLDSLLVGAYWSLTEWHAGQNSAEYAALCAIGSIFSPGSTSTPSEDDNEFIPYSAIGEYFAENSKAKAE